MGCKRMLSKISLEVIDGCVSSLYARWQHAPGTHKMAMLANTSFQLLAGFKRNSTVDCHMSDAKSRLGKITSNAKLFNEVITKM